MEEFYFFTFFVWILFFRKRKNFSTEIFLKWKKRASKKYLSYFSVTILWYYAFIQELASFNENHTFFKFFISNTFSILFYFIFLIYEKNMFFHHPTFSWTACSESLAYKNIFAISQKLKCWNETHSVYFRSECFYCLFFYT